MRLTRCLDLSSINRSSGCQPISGRDIQKNKAGHTPCPAFSLCLQLSPFNCRSFSLHIPHTGSDLYFDHAVPVSIAEDHPATPATCPWRHVSRQASRDPSPVHGYSLDSPPLHRRYPAPLLSRSSCPRDRSPFPNHQREFIVTLTLSNKIRKGPTRVENSSRGSQSTEVSSQQNTAARIAHNVPRMKQDMAPPGHIRNFICLPEPR
ncbi:protein of unknown function [Pseudodesulfovibrio profundus]|uniref:Uncharacterized protein n=1 Tax=Pseudodesulfovibrio profundus TaxID=57320 RepID=A0A2C8F9G0_9BACT|nr:protein of unknown function [Pseudodesulfovibrio profundus]